MHNISAYAALFWFDPSGQTLLFKSHALVPVTNTRSVIFPMRCCGQLDAEGTCRNALLCMHDKHIHICSVIIMYTSVLQTDAAEILHDAAACTQADCCLHFANCNQQRHGMQVIQSDLACVNKHYSWYTMCQNRNAHSDALSVYNTSP